MAFTEKIRNAIGGNGPSRSELNSRMEKVSNNTGAHLLLFSTRIAEGIQGVKMWKQSLDDMKQLSELVKNWGSLEQPQRNQLLPLVVEIIAAFRARYGTDIESMQDLFADNDEFEIAYEIQGLSVSMERRIKSLGGMYANLPQQIDARRRQISERQIAREVNVLEDHAPSVVKDPRAVAAMTNEIYEVRVEHKDAIEKIKSLTERLKTNLGEYTSKIADENTKLNELSQEIKLLESSAVDQVKAFNLEIDRLNQQAKDTDTVAEKATRAEQIKALRDSVTAIRKPINAANRAYGEAQNNIRKLSLDLYIQTKTLWGLLNLTGIENYEFKGVANTPEAKLAAYEDQILNPARDVMADLLAKLQQMKADADDNAHNQNSNIGAINNDLSETIKLLKQFVSENTTLNGMSTIGDIERKTRVEIKESLDDSVLELGNIMLNGLATTPQIPDPWRRINPGMTKLLKFVDSWDTLKQEQRVLLEQTIVELVAAYRTRYGAKGEYLKEIKSESERLLAQSYIDNLQSIIDKVTAYRVAQKINVPAFAELIADRQKAILETHDELVRVPEVVLRTVANPILFRSKPESLSDLYEKAALTDPEKFLKFVREVEDRKWNDKDVVIALLNHLGPDLTTGGLQLDRTRVEEIVELLNEKWTLFEDLLTKEWSNVRRYRRDIVESLTSLLEGTIDDNGLRVASPVQLLLGYLSAASGYSEFRPQVISVQKRIEATLKSIEARKDEDLKPEVRSNKAEMLDDNPAEKFSLFNKAQRETNKFIVNLRVLTEEYDFSKESLRDRKDLVDIVRLTKQLQAYIENESIPWETKATYIPNVRVFIKNLQAAINVTPADLFEGQDADVQTIRMAEDYLKEMHIVVDQFAKAVEDGEAEYEEAKKRAEEDAEIEAKKQTEKELEKAKREADPFHENWEKVLKGLHVNVLDNLTLNFKNIIAMHDALDIVEEGMQHWHDISNERQIQLSREMENLMDVAKELDQYRGRYKNRDFKNNGTTYNSFAISLADKIQLVNNQLEKLNKPDPLEAVATELLVRLKPEDSVLESDGTVNEAPLVQLEAAVRELRNLMDHASWLNVPNMNDYRDSLISIVSALYGYRGAIFDQAIIARMDVVILSARDMIDAMEIEADADPFTPEAIDTLTRGAGFQVAHLPRLPKPGAKFDPNSIPPLDNEVQLVEWLRGMNRLIEAELGGLEQQVDQLKKDFNLRSRVRQLQSLVFAVLSELRPYPNSIKQEVSKSNTLRLRAGALMRLVLPAKTLAPLTRLPEVWENFDEESIPPLDGEYESEVWLIAMNKLVEERLVSLEHQVDRLNSDPALRDSLLQLQDILSTILTTFGNTIDYSDFGNVEDERNIMRSLEFRASRLARTIRPARGNQLPPPPPAPVPTVPPPIPPVPPTIFGTGANSLEEEMRSELSEKVKALRTEFENISFDDVNTWESDDPRVEALVQLNRSLRLIIYDVEFKKDLPLLIVKQDALLLKSQVVLKLLQTRYVYKNYTDRLYLEEDELDALKLMGYADFANHAEVMLEEIEYGIEHPAGILDPRPQMEDALNAMDDWFGNVKHKDELEHNPELMKVHAHYQDVAKRLGLDNTAQQATPDTSSGTYKPFASVADVENTDFEADFIQRATQTFNEMRATLANPSITLDDLERYVNISIGIGNWHSNRQPTTSDIAQQFKDEAKVLIPQLEQRIAQLRSPDEPRREFASSQEIEQEQYANKFLVRAGVTVRAAEAVYADTNATETQLKTYIDLISAIGEWNYNHPGNNSVAVLELRDTCVDLVGRLTKRLSDIVSQKPETEPAYLSGLKAKNVEAIQNSEYPELLAQLETIIPQVTEWTYGFAYSGPSLNNVDVSGTLGQITESNLRAITQRIQMVTAAYRNMVGNAGELAVNNIYRNLESVLPLITPALLQRVSIILSSEPPRTAADEGVEELISIITSVKENLDTKLAKVWAQRLTYDLMDNLYPLFNTQLKKLQNPPPVPPSRVEVVATLPGTNIPDKLGAGTSPEELERLEQAAQLQDPLLSSDKLRIGNIELSDSTDYAADLANVNFVLKHSSGTTLPSQARKDLMERAKKLKNLLEAYVEADGSLKAIELKLNGSVPMSANEIEYNLVELDRRIDQFSPKYDQNDRDRALVASAEKLKNKLEALRDQPQATTEPLPIEVNANTSESMNTAGVDDIANAAQSEPLNVPTVSLERAKPNDEDLLREINLDISTRLLSGYNRIKNPKDIAIKDIARLSEIAGQTTNPEIIGLANKRISEIQEEMGIEPEKIPQPESQPVVASSNDGTSDQPQATPEIDSASSAPTTLASSSDLPIGVAGTTTGDSSRGLDYSPEAIAGTLSYLGKPGDVKNETNYPMFVHRAKLYIDETELELKDEPTTNSDTDIDAEGWQRRLVMLNAIIDRASSDFYNIGDTSAAKQIAIRAGELLPDVRVRISTLKSKETTQSFDPYTNPEFARQENNFGSFENRATQTLDGLERDLNVEPVPGQELDASQWQARIDMSDAIIDKAQREFDVTENKARAREIYDRAEEIRAKLITRYGSLIPGQVTSADDNRTPVRYEYLATESVTNETNAFIFSSAAKRTIQNAYRLIDEDDILPDSLQERIDLLQAISDKAREFAAVDAEMLDISTEALTLISSLSEKKDQITSSGEVEVTNPVDKKLEEMRQSAKRFQGYLKLASLKIVSPDTFISAPADVLESDIAFAKAIKDDLLTHGLTGPNQLPNYKINALTYAKVVEDINVDTSLIKSMYDVVPVFRNAIAMNMLQYPAIWDISKMGLINFEANRIITDLVNKILQSKLTEK